MDDFDAFVKLFDEDTETGPYSTERCQAEGRLDTAVNLSKNWKSMRHMITESLGKRGRWGPY